MKSAKSETIKRNLEWKVIFKFFMSFYFETSVINSFNVYDKSSLEISTSFVGIYYIWLLNPRVGRDFFLIGLSISVTKSNFCFPGYTKG